MWYFGTDNGQTYTPGSAGKMKWWFIEITAVISAQNAGAGQSVKRDGWPLEGGESCGMVCHATSAGPG